MGESQRVLVTRLNPRPTSGTVSRMPDTIDKTVFTEAYAQRPPWDIDGPQKPFRDLAGKISGTLLDAGCGSGENALFFASQGVTVTGMDFLEAPIEQAKRKAKERGIQAKFLVKDALTLEDWNERFDNVIDSGLLHVFSNEDRAVYVKGLETVLKPGGTFHLLCFSDQTPGDQGPRRITRAELATIFGKGWKIESIELANFEVRPEWREKLFAGDEPKGWFVTATRSEIPS